MSNYTPSPQPQPSPELGFGFLLPMLIALFLATLLIGIALLLPPFNLLDRVLGTQYAMLDDLSNAARSPDEQLTLILNPEDIGVGFGVSLAADDAEMFLSSPANDTVSAAVPTNLTPVSAIYTLDTTGTPPAALTLSMTIPEDYRPKSDLLDIYGYHVSSERWTFIASQPIDAATRIATISDTLPKHVALFLAAPPSAPTVVVSVDVTQTFTPDVSRVGTIVTPGGVQPQGDGTLTGSLAAGVQTTASYRVMPVIRNFVDPRALDVGTVSEILANDALRARHVQEIAVFAGTFSGVFIDYRGLPTDQRDNYAEFITSLGASLRARGARLGVVLPAAQNMGGTWDTGAYDWQRIGASADYVQVNLDRVDPTMFAPGADRLVEAMLRWGVGEISRYKLLVGLSAQSQWQASGGFTAVTYDDALAALGNVTIGGDLTPSGGIIPGAAFTAELDGLAASPGEDEITQTAYIDYLDDNGTPVTRVWLTTDEALSFRLNRVNTFALGGATFTDLLMGDPADGIFEAIGNYALGLPFEPTQTDLYLQWEIADQTGVIAQATTELNAPLVATIDALEGEYAVNVAVIADSNADNRRANPRGGVAVAVAAPTATPTPLPSPTPRPTSTPTNTPDPAAIAAAQAEATAASQPAQPSGGSFGAFVPGPGSIQVGQFEYGGHVTNTGSARAAGAMRTAGMNWMKVQVRFTPGDTPEGARAAIEGARQQGFKVLIGTVGAPEQLAFAGTDYIRTYSQWLGDVAAAGPDAIEVWNEPNIDREWPRGGISGESYFVMLREAYQAIKRANPSVLVISGAPAPTGAESAFPGQVVNDDRWLRQLVDAGGLQYMDCVGMHYNEGVVPPSARSGDPRDNYYTRYFGGMLDVYWGITGGQKPICITELGYLSPQGYPSLPPFFAWAQNVTVDQQAAWLAEAAALSSQSGRVRMMIVWNVDFTRYGSDPQGGYAMIRPGGACPACDAMAAAR